MEERKGAETHNDWICAVLKWLKKNSSYCVIASPLPATNQVWRFPIKLTIKSWYSRYPHFWWIQWWTASYVKWCASPSRLFQYILLRSICWDWLEHGNEFGWRFLLVGSRTGQLDRNRDKPANRTCLGNPAPTRPLYSPSKMPHEGRS